MLKSNNIKVGWIQKLTLGKLFRDTIARPLSLMDENVNGNHSPEVTNDDNSHSQRTKGDGISNSVHDIEAFKEFLLHRKGFN